MDTFKIAAKVVGILLAIFGAVVAVYYAVTKLLNCTHYFCDDDYDFLDCDDYNCCEDDDCCCDCCCDDNPVEEAAKKAAEEATPAEETTKEEKTEE